ncbi:M3 family oligoendopeptidase [Bacillus massiliglaciei]|uniref:M3 family oligoendopeptidase n=1 Tax=Bacillus massiliglaciei TaxID=1816693 RepID=UPI000DA62BEB|nr:M3 family oligoendopeptidase [Bacillus massiliglaciei]
MGAEMKWDLETLIKREEFPHFLHKVKTGIQDFEELVGNWQVSSGPEDGLRLHEALEAGSASQQTAREASAYISCLMAQDTTDTEAAGWQVQHLQSVAALLNAFNLLDQKLAEMEDGFFQELIQSEPLNQLRFILNERREKAKEKLSAEEEALITQLSLDGYEGWGQMYNTIVSTIKIPYEENGTVKELSAGQAQNLFSHPDRAVRERVFAAWEKAWSEKRELLARTLNHLAGFRLSVYEKRGWDHVLKEPLEYNRMEEATLDNMWKAISDQKGKLVQYMKRKAELLEIRKLGWADVDAPLAVGPSDTSAMSFQEGADFIVRQFEKFGPKLAAFAKKAFEERWIEAEDRPNKRPGGFCTGFPLSGQSRIFMTYSGTPSNVSTLAHELGHAYHSYVLQDIHPLNRGYAMNVAETASTFAEMIVADASVKEADSESEKLLLLDDKVQRSVALLMNIHARFLFETRFYEERKAGYVTADRLSTLMEEAQKEAFQDALADYHPTFWASKLHFYITGVPFYNFPYTFGYLFSLGIYAKAEEAGGNFEEKYISLLSDTGSMKVEDLAMKHLEADLTKEAFWSDAVGICVRDIEEFLEVTDPLVRKA